MSKSPRIIVAGRITADFYAQKSKFPQNIRIRNYTHLDSGDIFVGGSAGNTAVWLSALKIPLLLSISVGNDYTRDFLLALLDQRNIPTNFSIVDKPTSTSIVFLDNSAEPIFFHSPGANEDFNFLSLSNEISSGDILLVAGASLLNCCHDEKWKTFYDSLENKPKLVITTLCHGGKKGSIYKIFKETNYLIGNETELRPYNPSSNSLFDKYEKLKAIIMTRGKNGITIYTRTDKLQIPAQSTKLKDACGAGDSLVAGFLAGIFHNRNIEESIIIGTRLGAVCCEVVGPSVPPDHLYAMLTEEFPWLAI